MTDAKWLVALEISLSGDAELDPEFLDCSEAAAPAELSPSLQSACCFTPSLPLWGAWGVLQGST